MKTLLAYLSLAICITGLLPVQVHAQPSASTDSGVNYPEGFSPQNSGGICFTENKGQVHDQDYHLRRDVLFSGSDAGLIFHLKNNGVSFQLSRIDSWKENPVESFRKDEKAEKIPDQTTIYRLDINWLNANLNASVIGDKAMEGYNNYYLENCPSGALYVKSYAGVTFQNHYPGIDLKWYENEGHLKYDYHIAAGADYKQIKSEILGAEKIMINYEGELVFSTPLGDIVEAAPLVIQNGIVLKSRWILQGNVVSFDIENVDPTQAFVIDPALRIWGTYYGGMGWTQAYSCVADGSSNVFLAGYTDVNQGSIIATVGSHQDTIAGNDDAFLVKFNSAGVRLWGTYYGTAGGEFGNSCATDASGNVYLAGNTSASSGTPIATLGSHQPVYGGGGSDAFLVKFNSAGVRQWSSYYGGGGGETVWSCVTDTSGNVYIAGPTTSSSGTSISTTGSHQPFYGGGNNDAYLAKFNSSGVRQWSTYYGGGNPDIGYSCAVDASGYIYLTGLTTTQSGTAIATVGSHQPLSGSIYNAFLVQFNSSGARQWGTYYGGPASTIGFSCATDGNGNVFVAGSTGSNPGTIVATAGSHQAIFGGGSEDAFLVKFNSAGVRQWGTFYGGGPFAVERGTSCTTDANGNVYLAGYATENIGTSIATPNSHQATAAGSYDAFIAKFDSSGVRKWGTYYGGGQSDLGMYCAKDSTGYVYLSGYTSTDSGTSIATVGSHQPVYGGSMNAFLAKFCDNLDPPGAISGDTAVCSGSINAYSVSPVAGAISYTWTLPAGWSGTSTTNSIIATTNALSGTIAVAANNSCGSSISSTIVINVDTIPGTPLAISGPVSICSGLNYTYSVSPVAGATSYTWTLPSGWTGTSSTDSINVTASATSGNITVTATNICGTSASSTLFISPLTATPLAPGAISGINPVCSGSGYTYSIAPVASATSYTWILPGSWTGNSMIDSINTIADTTSGNITVTASNACGTSSASLLAVTANIPTTYNYTDSVCDSLALNGTTYTASGIYTQTLTNANGCDSTITLNLTIETLTATTTQSGSIFTATPAGATYQWIDCNNGNAPIAGETNQNFSPLVSGNYAVIVTLGSCTDTSNCDIFIGIIENDFAHSIMAFPNPTTGEIIISMGEKYAQVTVEISDVTGRMAGHHSIEYSDFIQLQISGAAGLYFVKIISNSGQQAVIKIVKE